MTITLQLQNLCQWSAKELFNSFTQLIVQWNPYLTYLWVLYSPRLTPKPWEGHPLLHINTLLYSHFVITSYIFCCCIHRAPYYPRLYHLSETSRVARFKVPPCSWKQQKKMFFLLEKFKVRRYWMWEDSMK